MSYVTPRQLRETVEDTKAYVDRKSINVDVDNTIIATPVSTLTHGVLKKGQSILIEDSLYYVIKDCAETDELIVGTNIIAATVSSIIYNMNSGKIFNIPTTGWVLDSAKNLYEYILQLNQIYTGVPEVDIAGSDVGVAATDDAIKAYSLLKAGATYVETSDNTLHLFATKAPESAFYILVKGVA